VERQSLQSVTNLRVIDHKDLDIMLYGGGDNESVYSENHNYYGTMVNKEEKFKLENFHKIVEDESLAYLDKAFFTPEQIA